MRIFLLALACLASPALSQEVITAEEFEALVEGRTLTYGQPGQEPYGMEHYFPNRRVTWAFMGSEECVEGTWHAEGPPEAPAICFDYEDDIQTQCWRIYRDGEGLRAEYLNDGSTTLLYELVDNPGGLVCGGVGV